jgi:hypothetical protein
MSIKDGWVPSNLDRFVDETLVAAATLAATARCDRRVPGRGGCPLVDPPRREV